MKVIGLVSKPGKPEAATLARQLQQKFADVEWLLESHLASAVGGATTRPEVLCERSEAVVVLGGDGTLIHTARLMRGKSTPILGVNLGSLGFMTEVPVAEALDEVGRLLSGESKTESRMKLACRLYRAGALVLEDEVLNDVVISKSALARIVDYETWLEGEYMATFKADGVIFSTPTGSTAYSLAAGGPIVHPGVDCVVVTPICPHALTQRPIVLPGDQRLSVNLNTEVTDIYLTIDGQAGLPLQRGDRVEVQKSSSRVCLVRNSSREYFGVLRQKLHWGER